MYLYICICIQIYIYVYIYNIYMFCQLDHQECLSVSQVLFANETIMIVGN